MTSGKKLEGKVAVITGSGRGIGRAIALNMAAEGAKIVVNDIGTSQNINGTTTYFADLVVSEIVNLGGTAAADYSSVATMEGGEHIIGTAIDQFGRLDILVNNAGNLRGSMIYNMTEEDWDAVITVHLKGHFTCTKPACIIMRKQESGRIINVSSPGGLGVVGSSSYAAAKEGIVGFTRSVAREMGRYGVTCNDIRPAAHSEMISPEDNRATYERAAKMGVVFAPALTPSLDSGLDTLMPEDIAPFVSYLASDYASDINGYDFIIYGGMISLMSQPEQIKTIYKMNRWSFDELLDIVPKVLMADKKNPAPRYNK